MDETQRKKFRHLLGELETRTELDRNADRARALERNRHAYRFVEVKEKILVPTLREFMVDLERGGHLTRLRTSAREKVRLDVQLHTAPPQRGSIEFVLHTDPGSLRIDYAWGWRVAQEIVGLETIDSKLVAERILQFLRELT